MSTTSITSASFSPLRQTVQSKSNSSNLATTSLGVTEKQGSTGSSSSSDPKTKMISYETFAPRSSTVRSNLTKIQALTSGPVYSLNLPSTATATTTMNSVKDSKLNTAATTTATTTTTGGSNMANGTSLKYLDAMLPPEILRDDAQYKSKSLETQDTHVQSTLARAAQTTNHLTEILTNTANLHKVLLETVNLAQSITDRHASLLQHSSELSLSAERLQNESSLLERHAMEIGLPLKHYDAVDRLGLQVGILFKNGNTVRGLSSVKVDDAAFPVFLDDVDAAIRFFAERKDMSAAAEDTASAAAGGGNVLKKSSEQLATSGSAEYYRRSLALHEACMDLFKEAIVDRISQTSLQIYGALDLKKKSVSGDTLEASLIYTRFHGISSRSRYLLNIIKERMGDKVVVPIVKSRKIGSRSEMVCPYTELWNLSRNTYIQNRSNLLYSSVGNHLDFLKDKHGLVGMTRLASVFLMRLCSAETALYLDFFGKADVDEEHNDDAEDHVTNTLNADADAAENSKENIHANESDETQSDSRTLQNGNINNSTKSTKVKTDTAALAAKVMAKDGTYYDDDFQCFLDGLCNNLHRTIRRALISMVDLDTLCQIVSVLREERSLANSSPVTMAVARSLGRVIVDAQERLIFCANGMLSTEVVRYKATPMDLDYPDKLRRWREKKDEMKNPTSNVTPSSIEDDALKLQMQIYESWFPPIRSVLKVLSKIFRVVEPKVFEDIALLGVQSCAKSLKEGSFYVEKKSGQLHCDLFLVKHLLILREQLSPFDMQLRSVERQLDFSDAGKAVSRFLANRNRRLFSMTTENALVTLLREGVHTREASIDSKRDLEDALRSACNAFIEHTSTSLAGPVITFIDQYKGITSTDTPLHSHSFLSSDYVKAIFTRTLDRLEPQLGEVTTQMCLYMENSVTRGILLKPVIKKVLRALEESKKVVNLCNAEVNSSWTDDTMMEVLAVIDNIEYIIKKATPLG
mmetsp:Transcript_8701/g.16419  ORF Transcript_8701/g.16419 Transcript_8701/m.16419 type:complete len:977 (+) Transcript_8701:112-3042(+)